MINEIDDGCVVPLHGDVVPLSSVTPLIRRVNRNLATAPVSEFNPFRQRDYLI